jgi:ethanolamine utilization microcompartment shell protein EutS
VYEQLLGFDGDEFYTARWPQLAGKRFGDCVALFPAAVAIGVVDRLSGAVTLLPDAQYLLSADTGVIVVAEDDDAYTCLEVLY